MRDSLLDGSWPRQPVRRLAMVLVGLAMTGLTLSLLWEILSVHVFRHDAAYYRPHSIFFLKMKLEGRWLNYLLYPGFVRVPGPLAIFADLACWFGFVYLIGKRWFGNRLYALAIAALSLQIGPLAAQLMWPASVLPAFSLLLVAGCLASTLPVYLFYILFSVLLFGALPHFYYLLPLVHLPLLDGDSLRANLKIVALRILPYWALGFIVGYLTTHLVVYVLSGQFGIEIAPWREPNPIESLADLEANVARAWRFLLSHLSNALTPAWVVIPMGAAMWLGIRRADLPRYLPMVAIAAAIMTVHYVMTIPVGIVVSFRTSIPVWLGVVFVVFGFPSISRANVQRLLPLVVATALAWHLPNRDIIRWYRSLTSGYHDQLLEVASKAPQEYRGVVLLSDSAEIASTNAALTEQVGGSAAGRLERQDADYWERLDRDYRWAPAAFEAGFSRVLFCGELQRHLPVCQRIVAAAADHEPLIQSDGEGLYRLHGEISGYLVVSLNPDVASRSSNPPE